MSEDLDLPNLDAGELDNIGNTESTEEKKEVKNETVAIPQNTTSEDLMKAILDVWKQQNTKSSVEVYGANGENYVDERDIDLEDMLDRPIRFFAHKAGYIIVDDTRKGQKQNNPLHKKAIIFEYVHTKRVWHGREQDIENLCIYECKSKKEAEWLRGHSQFGITFFDKLDAKMSQNAEFAVIAARYMRRVEDMDAHQIRKISQQEGVSTEMDIQEQRSALAIHYAQREMKANKKQYEQRVGNAITEQELLR